MHLQVGLQLVGVGDASPEYLEAVRQTITAELRPYLQHYAGRGLALLVHWFPEVLEDTYRDAEPDGQAVVESDAGDGRDPVPAEPGADTG